MNAAVDLACDAMLRRLQGNPWFLEEFWPENRARIRSIVCDVLESTALLDAPRRVLDIGCFNGFLCIIFRQLGFEATGADAFVSDEQAGIVRDFGIDHIAANFNAPDALSGVASESCAAVVCGEVVEHVFNHPLGFLRETRRILRPGGVLVLTTPNSGTAANAWRTLRGTQTLWGTPDFLDLPKVTNGLLSSDGHIHYREFLKAEIVGVIERAGLSVERHEYVSSGVSPRQPRLKRVLKGTALYRQVLAHTRLFGMSHYVVARRPP